MIEKLWLKPHGPGGGGFRPATVRLKSPPSLVIWPKNIDSPIGPFQQEPLAAASARRAIDVRHSCKVPLAATSGATLAVATHSHRRCGLTPTQPRFAGQAAALCPHAPAT
jgi:hypothetical protein